MRPFSGIGGVLAVALAAGSALPAEEPWREAPPLSAPPAEVLRAANALPPPTGTAVEILFRDTAITLDAEHRRTIVTHEVYRILTQQGVEEWSAVREFFAPWRQKRPTVRARVITPEGTQHDLDPATLTDAPLGSRDRDVFSDVRVLEGPLPAVSIGCIVETEATSQEDASLFAAGVVTHFGLGAVLPVRHALIRIEAPDSLTLGVASRPQGAFSESRDTRDGAQRVVAELRGYTPPDSMEGFLPPDRISWPAVSISTGSSWATVAAAYAAVVDRQIADADLSALARRVTASARTRPEKILAVVRYVHANVRYTGVEFGWAGLVPEKPTQVLTRKYGDCKDKSTLMVALLREAGIASHLALLETGFGPDVEPDLPGLGRFDHAIVRVEGEPEVWIDATQEHAPPGVLPPGVDGRLALVVRAGSAALVRIPEATSQSHRTREVREFFLAEEGPARVVEVTTAEGRFAVAYRSQQASGDLKEREEQLQGYVESTYGATKLERITAANIEDLERPFELRLEMAGASLGKSSAVDAQVRIPLARMAAELQSQVPSRTPQSERENDGGGEEDDPLRRSEFYMFSPYVAQWTYRIHPPPGFVPLALPPRVERAIGAASLVATFDRAGDGTVTVDARLDTGKRRWSATEYEAGRRALHELERDDPWVVSFEQVGEAHLRAGRLSEAMTEFRRLAALHPQEALHHDQIASVLLAAGLGEAARRQARLAVELEPGSAIAQQRLGQVLMSDLVGRELRPGSDLAGAEAALAKAKALDPESIPARALLALVLEYDARCVRYGSPEALLRAIEEYRALRADLGNTTADVQLLHCLGRAGRAQELHDTGVQLAESLERNQALVAAAAMRGGAEAGRAEAGRWTKSTQERQQLLAAAGFTLLTYRRYPEARALFEEGVRGAQAPAELRNLLDLLARTRKHEEIAFDHAKPVDFVRDFLRTILTLGSPASISAFLSPEAAGEEAEMVKAVGSIRAMMGTIPGNAFTPDIVADLGLAGVELGLSPIGGVGYEVSIRDGTGTSGGAQSLLLQKGAKGGLAVLAGPPDFSAVGRLAERLVSQGDLDGARRWLTHVRGVLPSATLDDPLDARPLAVVWSAGDTDALALRVAAAALRLDAGSRDDAVARFEALREEMPEEARWKADLLLAVAHIWQKRHEPALTHAERVLARFPRSRRARGLVASEMISLGRLEEAEARIREWQTEDPDDEQALELLLLASHKRGDVAQARQRFEALQAAGHVAARHLNNQAWFLLSRDLSEEALPLAERSVRLAPDSPGLHTLASVQAALGRLSDAHTTILQRIERFEGGEPQPVDGLVFGRIAEHLGEPAEAAAIYRQALPGIADEDSRRMVERRLRELEAGKGAPQWGWTCPRSAERPRGSLG